MSLLEDAAGGDDEPRHVVRIIARPNETEDAAVERYRAEHPATPDEAATIIGVFETDWKAIETADLERRLTAVEASVGVKQQ